MCELIHTRTIEGFRAGYVTDVPGAYGWLPGTFGGAVTPGAPTRSYATYWTRPVRGPAAALVARDLGRRGPRRGPFAVVIAWIGVK